MLASLRSSRSIVTICVLVLVATLVVSERAYAQKEFTIVGTVDCGLPSGRRCTIDDVLRLWTSDVTGERARFTVDVSWVKNQLVGYDQDDAICVEVRAMPDGTLQALGISSTCGAPPPTRRPTQEPRDGRQPDATPTPTATPKPAVREPLADLSLTKVGELFCPEGCYIVWTVVVRNDGPDAATNVRVGEYYDRDLQECFASSVDGSYDDEADIWTVGSLAVGESKTLELECDLDTSSEPDGFENTAEVISVDQRDPDSTPDNGDEEEDDWDTDFISMIE